MKRKPLLRRAGVVLLAMALLLSILTGCGSQPVPSTPVEEVAETFGTVPPEASAAVPVPSPEPAAFPSPDAAAEPSETPAPSPEQPSPSIEPSPSPAAGQEESQDPQIRQILENMTLEEKAAQLFVVTPEALGEWTYVGEEARAAFDQYPVGGVLCMGPNLEDPDQTRQMLSDYQQLSRDRIGLPLFLCVDEEGGTVARISGEAVFGISPYPDMADVGASRDTEWARQIGAEMGGYLSDLGFNVDFAPLADVLSNEENTVVRYRSFGSDANLVAEMAGAFAQGLQSRGVLGAYKHFPGHGATAEDSHEGFAYAETDSQALRERDLIPFADGIAHQIPFIMVGHIALPNVTGDDLPATLSHALVTDLLRQEMGYQGIIITDSMNMGAIVQRYGSGEAAVMALEAGADMILTPEDFSAALTAVIEAVEQGRLTEARIDESLIRILTVKLGLS